MPAAVASGVGRGADAFHESVWQVERRGVLLDKRLQGAQRLDSDVARLRTVRHTLDAWRGTRDDLLAGARIGEHKQPQQRRRDVHDLLAL